MNAQERFGLMAEADRRQRQRAQMLLGDLIAYLEDKPNRFYVDGLCSPHSYRGYYSDLAFESTGARMTAKQLLRVVRPCLGRSFCGHKGGDYMRDKATPLWLATECRTGGTILGYDDAGRIQIGTAK